MVGAIEDIKYGKEYVKVPMQGCEARTLCPSDAVERTIELALECETFAERL